MAKNLGKYFFAIVPDGEVYENAEHIKGILKDRFNLSYARRSPSHVTLKMPFTYNEAKESKLIGKLRRFTETFSAFSMKVRGVGRFGTRVIFLKILHAPELLKMQQALNQFCKTELKLNQELSDRNFTPHMTVAFRDLKKGKFWEYYGATKEMGFQSEFLADGITLLKKKDGKWIEVEKCRFNP